MGLKLFKCCFYIILIFLILFFFTRNINFFGEKFYKDIKEVENPNDIDVLVNKNNRLNKDFKPNDLVGLSLEYANESKFLRKEAALQFENLSKKAKEEGYVIVAVSGFRTFFYQQELFNYYVNHFGEKKALKASAKAGHSEHQTGLAIDVRGSSGNYNDFASTKEFEWMKNNAYQYGFILRYPKGKEKITGFKYEPWHYRYVGIDLANYLHENNITLEEYFKNK